MSRRTFRFPGFRKIFSLPFEKNHLRLSLEAFMRLSFLFVLSILVICARSTTSAGEGKWAYVSVLSSDDFLIAARVLGKQDILGLSENKRFVKIPSKLYKNFPDSG